MDKLINLNGSYLSDVEGHLTDVIQFLTDKLSSIPEEYRDSAKLEFDIWNDGYGGTEKSYQIFYYRPETPEEEYQRTHASETRKQEQEQREKQQLKALLEKYGPVV